MQSLLRSAVLALMTMLSVGPNDTLNFGHLLQLAQDDVTPPDLLAEQKAQQAAMVEQKAAEAKAALPAGPLTIDYNALAAALAPALIQAQANAAKVAASVAAPGTGPALVST